MSMLNLTLTVVRPRRLPNFWSNSQKLFAEWGQRIKSRYELEPSMTGIWPIWV